MTFRCFVFAGEPSGDALGAAALQGMREHSAFTRTQFCGVGGQGLEKFFPSLVPIDAFATMDWGDIVKKLGYFWKVHRHLSRTIAYQKPDLLLTFDCPELSLPLARRVKALSPSTCIVHVVAPSVWAWRSYRAKPMARYLDGLLTLLPFEPAYFQPHGLHTQFVGHPATTLRNTKKDPTFFRRYPRVDSRRPILCCLPGSRQSEVERMGPIFAETLQQFCKLFPRYQILVPHFPEYASWVESQGWIFIDSRERHQVFARSRLALATSGTVTLELAMASVPMITAYRMSRWAEFLAPRWIKTPFVSLPNICLDQDVVPEYLLQNCQPRSLCDALLFLHINSSAQKSAWKHLGSLFPQEPAWGERVAESIFTILQRKRQTQSG